MAELNNGNGISNGVKSSVKAHPNGTVPLTNGRTSYAAKHKLADHFIGGNRLENAVAGPVKDFVANHDGHTVITNVRIVFGEVQIYEYMRLANYPLRSSLPTMVLRP